VPAQLVARAVERWGRLDVVVGNAGGPPHGGALDVDDEALLAAVNANMLASIRLARAAVPPPEGGRLGPHLLHHVGHRPPAGPMLALSNVARTGLWAWAKTAASDLAGDGITVNLACPGAHLTERLAGLGGQAGGARVGDPTTSARSSPSSAPSPPAS
jgi:3-oxoacyl-[acyl-carrier protein] reductase